MSRFRPRNKSFWLAQLFESNYRKLCELIPELAELHGHAVAFSSGKPALHLRVVDRSRYTLTVELNHCFDGDFQRLIEPHIKIRVYLDGKCAEALGTQRETTTKTAPRCRPADILEDKWTANYFLERWLSHCLRNRYRFERSSATPQPAAVA